jgi:hypothetical protein
MKLRAQSNMRVQRPACLLEWNRWFAWHPVPLVIDGKLHYAWLQTVERKWGTGRYGGTIKWRLPAPSALPVAIDRSLKLLEKLGSFRQIRDQSRTDGCK